MSRSRWEPRRGDLPPEWIRRRAPVLQDLQNNALFRMVAFRRRGPSRVVFFLTVWTLPAILCFVLLIGDATVNLALPILAIVGAGALVLPFVFLLSAEFGLHYALFQLRKWKWLAWCHQSRLTDLASSSFDAAAYAAGIWAAGLVPRVLIPRLVRDLFAIALAASLLSGNLGGGWEILVHPMLFTAAASITSIIFEPFPALFRTAYPLISYQFPTQKDLDAFAEEPGSLAGKNRLREFGLLGCASFYLLVFVVIAAFYVSAPLRVAMTAILGVMAGVTYGLLTRRHWKLFFERIETRAERLLRALDATDRAVRQFRMGDMPVTEDVPQARGAKTEKGRSG